MNEVAASVVRYVTQLPVFIMWVMGIILAIRYWHRFVKVSRAALMGFLILIVSSIVFTFLTEWLPRWLLNKGLSPDLWSGAIVALALVGSLFSAVGYAFVIRAIFGWRQ